MNSVIGYHWPQCRVCKINSPSNKLVKYGVRHYAHPDCALKKWGASFFDRLTPWQAKHQFPALIAAEYGVTDALLKRAEQYRP